MGYGLSTIRGAIFASSLLWLTAAHATSVPGLSFEQLTDQSDLVVSGQITRAWTDWDAEHKYIWTHYELSVASALKGSPGETVELSEPGGTVGLLSMTIAGAVTYSPGETALVFLQRMPNGYLRTTGWSQGKFLVDKSGRIHQQAPGGGLEVVKNGQSLVTRIGSLEGMSVAQAGGLVTARAQAQSQRRTK